MFSVILNLQQLCSTLLTQSTSGSTFIMDEQLLHPDYTPEKEHSPSYDPFRNPPDLSQAQTHAKATKVGTILDVDDPQFCPCCDGVVNKNPIPVCFDAHDILILGTGYPVYYRLSKQLWLMMVCIFFLSGSGYYFYLFSSAQSWDSVYFLFGIPLLDLNTVEKTNLNKTDIINISTAVFIFLLVVYVKSTIQAEVVKLSSSKVCPSLYTVMLQNVPVKEVDDDDEDLKKWIEAKFGCRPIIMNWAYDVDQLKKTYESKQSNVIALNALNIKLRKHDENKQQQGQISADHVDETGTKLRAQMQSLKYKIDQERKLLEDYNNQKVECKKVGTVFVTFEKCSTVNEAIQKYQCSFFNAIVLNLFSFIKQPSLFYKSKTILLNKAPAPNEVIWDNLGFSYIRSLVFQLFFISCMVGALWCIWRLLLGFMNYALEFKIEGKNTGQALVLLKALAVSVLILVVNCLARKMIEWFTFAKKYYSYTKMEGSFSLYYSIFYIINACCLVYIVHGHNNNDTKELLYADIHVVMLASAFSQPAFKLVDPTMWFRFYRRYRVSRLPPQDNPYTQEYVNELWEGPNVTNGDNYQYITRTVFITTWFASVAPLGVLLSLIAFALDYWISRYLLVRVYRVPQNISEDVARPTLMMLELLPLVYIGGVLQYNYKVSDSQNIFIYLYNVLHLGISIVVLFLTVIGYVLFCRRPVMPEVALTYNQQKLGFGNNYETANPITKLKGDINYLYEVLACYDQESPNGEAAASLIKRSRKSSASIRGDLKKLKMKMLRRVTMMEELEVEMDYLDRSEQRSARSKSHRSFRQI